jgi:hypothetical protein
MQKNWLGISALLKRTERSDINSASGGSIFNLQFRLVRVRAYKTARCTTIDAPVILDGSKISQV